MQHSAYTYDEYSLNLHSATVEVQWYAVTLSGNINYNQSATLVPEQRSHTFSRNPSMADY